MNLDPTSGFITGRPTSTFNQDITFSANDGVTPIQATVNLKVNAAGGGGNAGRHVRNDSLAEGRVGEAYTATLALSENGVGPFVFGAVGPAAGPHPRRRHGRDQRHPDGARAPTSRASPSTTSARTTRS